MEGMISLRPEESVAIVECQGFMAAARMVQIIGQETRARVVAVSPMNALGNITTIIAGPLAEVQHALQTLKAITTDAIFFARPNLETMELLFRSALGGAANVHQLRQTRREETLPLFDHSDPAPKQQRHRTAPSLSEPFERKSLFELERFNVHELRKYARHLPDFPIVGRAISRANRSELLQLIKSYEESAETRAARSTSPAAMLPS